jgi:hypothetical protein
MTTFEQQVENVKAGKRILRNLEGLSIPEQYIEYPVKQAIYLSANGLKNPPKCGCGSQLRFISCQTGYLNSCNSCRVTTLNQLASKNNQTRNTSRSTVFRDSISGQVKRSVQDYHSSLKTIQQISEEYGVSVHILNTYIKETTSKADRRARGGTIRSEQTRSKFQQPLD